MDVSRAWPHLACEHSPLPRKAKTLRFTDSLLADVAPIHEAIAASPFPQGLANGTLPREVFRTYLVLADPVMRAYVRAASLCAARAPSLDLSSVYTMAATQMTTLLAGQRETFHATYDITAREAREAVLGPATSGYTDHIIARAGSGPIGEGAAALLAPVLFYPTFMRRLNATAVPDTPYRDWLELHGGTGLEEMTSSQVLAVNAIAEDAGADERRLMRAAFLRQTQWQGLHWNAMAEGDVWPENLTLTPR